MSYFFDDLKPDMQTLFFLIKKRSKLSDKTGEWFEKFEILLDEFNDLILNNKKLILKVQIGSDFQNRIYKWEDLYFHEGTDVDLEVYENLSEALESDWLSGITRDECNVSMQYKESEIPWEEVETLKKSLKTSEDGDDDMTIDVL